MKDLDEPSVFKLIEDQQWTMINEEPASESKFFKEGHGAMSVISVLGPRGSGKSSILNLIAGKQVFPVKLTHDAQFTTRHTTRGIDIYATHQRILLDCQPMLSASVLGDFFSGRSKSQFPSNSNISDPITSSELISLQLATFLITVSDFVIITLDWLMDINLFKLIASALMLIGEDNLRAKFVIYCQRKTKILPETEALVAKLLGRNRVDKFFTCEKELIDHLMPYSDLKTVLHSQDRYAFNGYKWFNSCKRIWNNHIRGPNMFHDFANLSTIKIDCLH